MRFWLQRVHPREETCMIFRANSHYKIAEELIPSATEATIRT